jgi:hypothetical protein
MTDESTAVSMLERPMKVSVVATVQKSGASVKSI